MSLKLVLVATCYCDYKTSISLRLSSSILLKAYSSLHPQGLRQNVTYSSFQRLWSKWLEIEWGHFGPILEFLSSIFLFSLQSLVYFSNTSYLDRVLASYFPPVVFLFHPILYLTVLLYKKFSAVTLLLKSSHCPNYWTKVKISGLFLMISQCFTETVPIVSC